LTLPFVPPPASRALLRGVDFARAVPCLAEAKAHYDAFDATEAGRKDPNRCKALLEFPDGTVFFSAKMAVDADGPPAGPGLPDGKALDPATGRPDTSFTFADGSGLPSAAIPYIVLPQSRPRSNRPFHPRLAIGDLAVVIYGKKISPAICGDLGPYRLIGETSIRVHETLRQRGMPDPCRTRDARGNCLKILNESVGEDVLYFVFPGSALGPSLNRKNAERRIGEAALECFARFKARQA
jgi:hypothetical protein